jgi:hypothetical protein
MGLGASLVLASFAMLFALGLAGFGYFKGDPFVAGSVVAVTTLVAVFTFFPVARVLISALQDAGGAFSLSATPSAFSRRRSGVWAASPAAPAAASRGTRSCSHSSAQRAAPRSVSRSR